VRGNADPFIRESGGERRESAGAVAVRWCAAMVNDLPDLISDAMIVA
jgi:hypothetical protein